MILYNLLTEKKIPMIKHSTYVVCIFYMNSNVLLSLFLFKLRIYIQQFILSARLSYLQVAVASASAAPAFAQVTSRWTVKEVAIVVAAAILVQDVPHLWLKERHVHVYGYDLQETTKRYETLWDLFFILIGYKFSSGFL